MPPDEHYNQSRINVDSKTLQIHEVEQATKKALAHATKDYNLAMVSHTHTHSRPNITKYNLGANSVQTVLLIILFIL